MKKTGCLREIQSGKSANSDQEVNAWSLTQPFRKIHTTTRCSEGPALLGGGGFSQNMQTPRPSRGHADVQHLAQSSAASLCEEQPSKGQLLLKTWRPWERKGP